MASVRRKDRSPYWFACFYDENGNAKCISTKSKNKKDALRIANEWESAWQKKVTTVQAQNVLNDILKLVGQKEIPTQTFDEVLDLWLKERKPEVKASSYDQYLGFAKTIRAHLGVIAQNDIQSIRHDHIVALRSSLVNQVGPSTTNKHLDLLRMVFGYAERRRFIERSPMIDVKHVAVPVEDESARRNLTLPEIRSLLNVASPLWVGLILCGLYLGQRLGDIARLTWGRIYETVEGDRRRYQFVFRTGKTTRPMIIPVAAPLERHLRSIRPANPAPNDLIFPEAAALLGKTGKVQRLSNCFYGLLVKAKLASKRSKANTGKGHSGRRKVSELSFHSLRHSATSLLKSAGVPQAVVMDIIGHESTAISRAYTHIDDQSKARAIDNMEDVTT